jgi:hypothetical protein
MPRLNKLHITAAIGEPGEDPNAPINEALDHLAGNAWTVREDPNRQAMIDDLNSIVDKVDESEGLKICGKVSQLVELFKQLRTRGVRLDYLDFHGHGYPAGLKMGYDTLEYKDLSQFRDQGFHEIFNPGAEIWFCSCDIAGMDLDDETQDGERFLAEFAQIFLRGNGGTVKGGAGYVHYKPSTAWRGPKFNQDKGWVIAQVAPGSGVVQLKGQFYLDTNRLRAEIATLTVCVDAALQTEEEEQTEILMQLYLGDLPSRVLEQIRDAVQFRLEKNQQLLRDFQACRTLLQRATDKVKKPAPSLQELHDTLYLGIEPAARKLVQSGVPVAQVGPQLIAYYQTYPVAD